MSGKKILIGVTGGIAVYKACELVRLLRKQGDETRVIMTANARRFVAPLTFEVLSQNSVPRGMFESRSGSTVEHVEAAAWCDLFAVVPATANFIGKLSAGVADDHLTTLALAVPRKKPVLLAPAMNVEMWNHPVVQRNLRILTGEEGGGVIMIPPVEKELACGDVGMGGLAPVEAIFKAIQEALS